MDFIFNSEPLELVFNSPTNDRRIIFHYREPAADERIRYGSAIYSVCRNKNIEEIPIEDIERVQFQFGFLILEGFRMSGISVNISSDPGSPQFDADWKNKIANRAPGLVILLARSVFGTEGGFAPEKNL
jgi:hypothetical protein